MYLSIVNNSSKLKQTSNNTLKGLQFYSDKVTQKFQNLKYRFCTVLCCYFTHESIAKVSRKHILYIIYVLYICIYIILYIFHVLYKSDQHKPPHLSVVVLQSSAKKFSRRANYFFNNIKLAAEVYHCGELEPRPASKFRSMEVY